jgi:SAM-dependent methyltransferase
MSKYIHKEVVHNVNDPQKIVPAVIKILNPKSVVDIGCGLGTFLSVFKQQGVTDVLGIDGPWVDKNLLQKNIALNEFKEMDLEKEIVLEKKYDLVVSLEVAEHLAKEKAELFVKSLINSGNVILFSAALPNQRGQNHINEQWLSYWEAIFNKQGYVIHDVIRPIFWNDKELFWWYRQNMVLVTPKDYVFSQNLPECPMRDLVHPELFESRNKELEEITSGKKRKLYYLRLLLKSFIGDSADKFARIFTGKK